MFFHLHCFSALHLVGLERFQVETSGKKYGSSALCNMKDFSALLGRFFFLPVRRLIGLAHRANTTPPPIQPRLTLPCWKRCPCWLTYHYRNSKEGKGPSIKLQEQIILRWDGSEQAKRDFGLFQMLLLRDKVCNYLRRLKKSYSIYSIYIMLFFLEP